jgi:hypothetical protein
MNNIKLLIQWYARKEKDGKYKATSTTVLIYSVGKIVLVDPGLNPV